MLALRRRTLDDGWDYFNRIVEKCPNPGIVAFAVLCILFPRMTHSQDSPPALEDNPVAVAGNIMRPVSLQTDKEFLLSVIVLIFGTTTAILIYRLFNNSHLRTEQITRTYTVLLIIIGTLLLISAGFSNEQIAPALGLFGTIAGYLLGRSDRRKCSSAETQEDHHD